MDLTEVAKHVHKKKNRKRIGRGNGSNWGHTCGKGHKGQKSRKGYTRRQAFEGGQMPLFRRIPKRGFNNANFSTDFVPINVGMLDRFEDGAEVSVEELKNSGIVKKIKDGIKILGSGEITKKLTITAHRFSKSAREKIEKAGGKCIELMPAKEKQDKDAKESKDGKPVKDSKPSSESEEKQAKEAKGGKESKKTKKTDDK